MLQSLTPKDARILIVGDTAEEQELAKRSLKGFGVRHISVAGTAEDALIDLMKHSYDVALLHVGVTGLDSLRFVENLRRVSPQTRVIVVAPTRQERLDPAIRRLQALDYISKDEYLTSRVIRAVHAALRDRSLEARAVEGRNDPPAQQEFGRSLEEAGWLLKAMDERQLDSMADGGLDLRRAQDWNLVVDTFATYIQASGETFPRPAARQLEDLVEAVIERSLGPREVFALYMQAVKSLMHQPGSGSLPASPSLFLVQAFACLVERLQSRAGVGEAA